jgi:intracellular sulfur oxidation DsrE/DsrF family protein
MSASPKQPTNRREFLASLATGSAALAASGMALHVNAAEGHAESIALDSPMTDAWLSKLNGKHKQFFDASMVNDGFALAFAMNFLNMNNDAYKIPDKDLTAVVGFRHFATPMGFNDDIWNRYKLGEFFKVNDPATKAPATRNVFYHAHDGDLPFPGMAIDKLQARGVTFTVCNMALGVISGMTSKNAGVTPDVAKAQWTAGLLPGMVLVPAGVLAVNRAQEKGCTYCSGG